MASKIEELSERELEAAQTVLEYADIEPSHENTKRYLDWEIVTFSEDAAGHYCWYMDDEGNEICIKVETLEEICTEEFD